MDKKEVRRLKLLTLVQAALALLKSESCSVDCKGVPSLHPEGDREEGVGGGFRVRVRGAGAGAGEGEGEVRECFRRGEGGEDLDGTAAPMLPPATQVRRFGRQIRLGMKGQLQ
ncbi:hypothetical protein ACLOJK_030937 [Asimina triloba]